MGELVEATADEKRERDVVCHPEWGARLTVPQFLEREARLRAHPWSKAAMTTWLWREGAEGAVLASCETFRMESWLGAEQGSTYGVASVFTEPSLRGRGHAGSMMRALIARLPDLAGAPAQASILFSDVGAALYERAGYAAVPPPMDRVFAPASLSLPSAFAARRFSCASFTEQEVPAELAATPRPDLPFLVWPTAAQLDWHYERARIYADLLKLSPLPSAGARVANARVFWAADLKNDRLVILLLSANDPDEAVSLLGAARHVAHHAGLSEVVLWEEPAPRAWHWPEGPDGGVLRERDGALPMLAPLDVRVSAGRWTVLPRALWV